MSGQAAPPRASLSRRRLLGLAPAAVGLLLQPVRHAAVAAPPALAAFERLHRPVVEVPLLVSNGAKVPIVVEMAHPMDPDHYITAIEVVNPRDPVPSKGRLHLTPASGQVYLAFQARMDEGASELAVTAECNMHGRWSTTEPIRVVDGAGGCAGSEPPGRPSDEIVPPRIRIPAAVKGRPIRRDQIIDVQVIMRHPNRTGLALRGGAFVRVSEPFHITELSVFYGGGLVSRYEATAALSDDPFITFRLRAGGGGPVRVVVTNTRGQRFEALSEVPVW